MSIKKKAIVSLPLKVLLSQSGCAYFVQEKKKFAKIRTADSSDEFGLSLNSIVASSLQTMILIGYVSKLEISMAEFRTFRKEIMDISKMTIYSILYRQFNTTVRAKLLDSEEVRKYNRMHPMQVLDDKTHISEANLKVKLSAQKNRTMAVRQQLLEPIQNIIGKNRLYTAEEKNMNLLVAEKFIDNLDFFCWFLLVKFADTEGFPDFVQIIMSVIISYLDKTRLAEYISLAVLELARYCENCNLRHLARYLYPGTEDVNKLIFDPDTRNKLTFELLNRHEVTSIAWKFISHNSGAADAVSGKLQISLYGRIDSYKQIRDALDTVRQFDLEKHTLIDMSRSVPVKDKQINLGMFYLAYLEESCEKLGVKMEILVTQPIHTELTVIDLNFIF